jgi:hypothetical protein
MMMAPLPPHYQMASPRQPLAAEAAAGKAASASQLTSSCPQGDRQPPKGEDQIYRSCSGKYLKKRTIYTDKKENQIFLIYKKIQGGAVVKSYMTNGLLIYGEIIVCAFPHILGSPSSYMTLQLLHFEFPYI